MRLDQTFRVETGTCGVKIDRFPLLKTCKVCSSEPIKAVGKQVLWLGRDKISKLDFNAEQRPAYLGKSEKTARRLECIPKLVQQRVSSACPLGYQSKGPVLTSLNGGAVSAGPGARLLCESEG